VRSLSDTKRYVNTLNERRQDDEHSHFQTSFSLLLIHAFIEKTRGELYMYSEGGYKRIYIRCLQPLYSLLLQSAVVSVLCLCFEGCILTGGWGDIKDSFKLEIPPTKTKRSRSRKSRKSLVFRYVFIFNIFATAKFYCAVRLTMY
jgi:hypothetical protein